MITYIEALNYKCLRNISVELGQFHILVGSNASGKSTFLDIISFLGDIINNGPETAVIKRSQSLKELVWKGESNEFQLVIELRIPDRIKDQFQKNGNKYSHCRYEINVGIDPEKGGISLLAENFFLRQKQSPDKIRTDFTAEQMSIFPHEPHVLDNIIQESRKHTPTGWRRVVSLGEGGRAYIRSETTKWNFPLKPGPQKSALTMVPEEERFPCSTWAKSVFSEGIHALTLNSRKMRQPCRPDASLSFLSDGSNLPIVIANLLKTNPDRFHMWLDHVKTVLPDIRNIDVRQREVDKFLFLLVEYTNGINVPSWLLSDGTLRLLALTVLAYFPSSGKIFLIEEPENGIHPKALDAVYQSLSSVYEGQVLCATHSPLLLGLSQIHQLLCFAVTDNGSTDIVSGDKHPALQSWKGQANLETLYAAGVLG